MHLCVMYMPALHVIVYMHQVLVNNHILYKLAIMFYSFLFSIGGSLAVG